VTSPATDDKRQPLLQLLAAYRNRYPDESEVIGQYQSFIEQHPDCFERSLDVGHVTGSAIILDSSSQNVLLTHHRKLNRWLQPGGHADGDPVVSRVAMKEALEESGLSDIRFVQHEILDLDIHLIPERGNEAAHYHYDSRYLLQSAGETDEFVVSEESHDLAWVPIDQISDYTDEDSILRMLEKATRLLSQ
jgi:8-oxo-dGTP pyrophosphatase MutT (NUDIX family)